MTSNQVNQVQVKLYNYLGRATTATETINFLRSHYTKEDIQQVLDQLNILPGPKDRIQMWIVDEM